MSSQSPPIAELRRRAAGFATGPGPMTPVRYRVAGTRLELAAPRTVTLALVPLDEPLPPFRAGQFNMVWSFGVGEVAVSVSGDPSRTDTPLLHTVRSVGAVTASLCAAQPGDVVGLRGPFGTPWGVEDAVGGDVVFVGGGIGVAPLRSAIDAVLARRDAYGHVAVLIGARSPGDLLYPDEVESWSRRGDLQVEVTVDRAEGSWRGDVGVVTTLIPHIGGDPARTTAFVCGPEVMMRFVAAALVERGVPASRVRISMERNMKCGVAQCGHCQYGESFVCTDGPVFGWDRVGPHFRVVER